MKFSEYLIKFAKRLKNSNEDLGDINYETDIENNGYYTLSLPDESLKKEVSRFCDGVVKSRGFVQPVGVDYKSSNEDLERVYIRGDLALQAVNGFLESQGILDSLREPEDVFSLAASLKKADDPDPEGNILRLETPKFYIPTSQEGGIFKINKLDQNPVKFFHDADLNAFWTVKNIADGLSRLGLAPITIEQGEPTPLKVFPEKRFREDFQQYVRGMFDKIHKEKTNKIPLHISYKISELILENSAKFAQERFVKTLAFYQKLMENSETLDEKKNALITFFEQHQELIEKALGDVKEKFIKEVNVVAAVNDDIKVVSTGEFPAKDPSFHTASPTDIKFRYDQPTLAWCFRGRVLYDLVHPSRVGIYFRNFIRDLVEPFLSDEQKSLFEKLTEHKREGLGYLDVGSIADYGLNALTRDEFNKLYEEIGKEGILKRLRAKPRLPRRLDPEYYYEMYGEEMD